MATRCIISGCGRQAIGQHHCSLHYSRKRHGRPLQQDRDDDLDPQPFVKERRSLMRIDRTKKPDDQERIDAMERDAEDDDKVPEPRFRPVRMPYVRFLDPAHQKVKTP